MLEVAIASFELALHPPKGDITFDPKTPLNPEQPDAEKRIEPDGEEADA